MAVISVALGLALLVWSAGRFVEGAASTARYFAVPPLLVGMVVVGFGTSAPEMAVSALAASQGSGGIALGNAYGSNITNISLILGVTALVSPIAVRSRVLRKEIPILAGVTALTAWLLLDGKISSLDAAILLSVFAGLLGWSVWQGTRRKNDALAAESEQEMNAHAMPIRRATFWLVAGLALLIVGSRLLVWGAVEIAHVFGVNDLIIGLSVVAVGTSLPELASTLSAARRGEHDIALGNILGSNLFNTLAVVGLAGTIRPLEGGSELLWRDVSTMAVLTAFLFVVSYSRSGTGRISRVEGGLLLACYVGYTGFLVLTAF